MQPTTKVSETIHRGVTAIAMTIAISTLYSAVVTEGRVTRDDNLQQQIQTVFKRLNPNAHITQDSPTPQESLSTLVSTSPGHGYSHR